VRLLAFCFSRRVRRGILCQCGKGPHELVVLVGYDGRGHKEVGGLSPSRYGRFFGGRIALFSWYTYGAAVQGRRGNVDRYVKGDRLRRPRCLPNVILQDTRDICKERKRKNALSFSQRHVPHSREECTANFGTCENCIDSVEKRATRTGISKPILCGVIERTRVIRRRASGGMRRIDVAPVVRLFQSNMISFRYTCERFRV
jgi:hypothetical protein